MATRDFQGLEEAVLSSRGLGPWEPESQEQGVLGVEAWLCCSSGEAT